jgi:hypothetical protein
MCSLNKLDQDYPLGRIHIYRKYKPIIQQNASSIHKLLLPLPLDAKES